MRTVSKTYKLYSFAELSEEAKKTALEKLQDINIDYEWWDQDYEDYTMIGALMGITIDKIYFSGFSSQGDGACFEGKYHYQKGAIKKLSEHCPKETTVFYIARQLNKLQRENHNALRATVKHSGHYYHKYETEIDVTDSNEETNEFINISIEDKIIELLRDFMEWIYRQLEKEYNYRTSEKAIIETIEANEYEFLANGELSSL
jgi:hypothetical protein